MTFPHCTNRIRIGEKYAILRISVPIFSIFSGNFDVAGGRKRRRKKERKEEGEGQEPIDRKRGLTWKYRKSQCVRDRRTRGEENKEERKKERNERAGRKSTSTVHSLSFSSDDHRFEERNTQGSWLRGKEGGEGERRERGFGCRGVAGARDG